MPRFFPRERRPRCTASSGSSSPYSTTKLTRRRAPPRVFGTPPDWALLDGWLSSALPRGALEADIVGAPPATWSLDAARRGAKGSRCHSSLDKVELQHRARASVAAALPGVQHVRSDEAADLALHLVVSPVRVSAGVELLTRRVRKGYLPHKGLHHSVSWGLARTAALRPGEVAIDACCGTAALLVEASVYFPEVHYVGIDASPEQLAKAAANVASHPGGAAAAARLTLLRGDAGALPVRRRSVDACVCDLPFGRQHGDADSNRALYVRLLAELGRILRPPRGRAVLLAMGATSEALVDASSSRRRGSRSTPRCRFASAPSTAEWCCCGWRRRRRRPTTRRSSTRASRSARAATHGTPGSWRSRCSCRGRRARRQGDPI